VTGRWRLGRASAGAVVDAEADVSIDLGTGTVTFGEARRDITRSAGLDDQRKRGMSSARTEPRYRIEARPAARQDITRSAGLDEQRACRGAVGSRLLRRQRDSAAKLIARAASA
jgi:hypothetical protein